jgi:hypothetical protein
LDNIRLSWKIIVMTLPHSRSTSIFFLLSALLPAAVIAGGCLVGSSAPSPQSSAPSCCFSQIVYDPSYEQPPNNVLWNWLLPSPRPSLTERFRLGSGHDQANAELRTYLLREPSNNAFKFLSSLGLHCYYQTSMICVRDIPVYYVCVPITRDANNQDRRYETRLRIEVKATDHEILDAGAGPVHNAPLCPKLN